MPRNSDSLDVANMAAAINSAANITADGYLLVTCIGLAVGLSALEVAVHFGEGIDQASLIKILEAAAESLRRRTQRAADQAEASGGETPP